MKLSSVQTHSRAVHLLSSHLGRPGNREMNRTRQGRFDAFEQPVTKLCGANIALKLHREFGQILASFDVSLNNFSPAPVKRSSLAA